jgi:peptidoglycan/LPS O-acetylase OafA/YrhL
MHRGNRLSELAKEKPIDSSNNFLYIRLLASTLVVLGHSFGLAHDDTRPIMNSLSILGFPIHGLGVFIFFTLSGYLITSSIHNSKTVLQYALSRAFRIFPALIVCVLLTALALGPIVSVLPASSYFNDPGTWQYIANNGSLRMAVFALPGIDYAINGSLWTIPMEGRLYVVIGLLGLLTCTRSRTLFTACLLIVFYFISTDKSSQIPGSIDNLNIVTCFMIGAIFYLYRAHIPMSADIAVGLAALSYLLRDTSIAHLTLFITVGYIVLLAGYAKVIPKSRLIADYSYGIYLYAFPIQATLIHYMPTLSGISVAFISIPAAWLAGAASWYAIEKPANALKMKLSRATRLKSRVTATVPKTADPVRK